VRLAEVLRVDIEELTGSADLHRNNEPITA